MAYTLSDENLSAQVHAFTAQNYEWGAAWLSDQAGDGELPMAPDLLVRVIYVLTESLVL